MTDHDHHWPIDARRLRAGVRAARAAGRRGDPDPAESLLAPSCFTEILSLYSSHCTELASAFVDEHREQLVFVAKHYDLIDIALPLVWHGRPANLDEEIAQRNAERHAERITSVRGALAGVRLDFARHQVELRGVESAWAGQDATMKDAYRSRYIFDKFWHRLIFPVLDVSALDYTAGGLDLAAFLREPGPGWRPELS